MRWFRVFVGMTIIASLCIGLGFTPDQAIAADITVGNGIYACSRDGLADAILEASPGGTVTFDCNPATITFNSEIEITQNVTIDGSNNGSPIIFDGNDATRFFDVTSGTLTLQHLTLKNGKTDQGTLRIAEDAAAEITDVTFDSNTATVYGGAIYNEGTLTITQSTFDSNTATSIGGAIDNLGTLTISQSSFIANSSGGDGGAIENAGDLTIRRSSFVNNHSSAIGGAIDAWLGSITIIASTLTGNTAGENNIGHRGSSIYISPDLNPVRIIASTIIQPENATPALYIHANDAVILEGVILGGDGPHCEFIANGDLTDTHTLSNDSSCNLQGTGSSQNVANLLLGPLTTATINGIDQSYYPLLQGSPAINAGPTTCDTDLIDGPDTDQLGNPRPIGPACDIGAIEGLILYPATLCANQWTGALKVSDNCSRSETTITLPDDAPLELCVNTWNSATRLAGTCTRAEHPVSISGDHSIPICINRWNHTIRITDHCTRSEHADWL